MFNNNLDKNLENIVINLSEIIEASKNKNLKNLHDRNINFYYNYDIIETHIKANNKNYIINCDKIDKKYNYAEIKLNGNENGSLIVKNNQNYSCNISRIKKGNGHAILSGSRNGDVWRRNMGYGHAIRLGSGKDNASRYNKGHEHAIRIKSGDDGAWREDNGIGYAIGLSNNENIYIIKI